jgi:hypothetical protein
MPWMAGGRATRLPSGKCFATHSFCAPTVSAAHWKLNDTAVTFDST